MKDIIVTASSNYKNQRDHDKWVNSIKAHKKCMSIATKKKNAILIKYHSECIKQMVRTGYCLDPVAKEIIYDNISNRFKR